MGPPTDIPANELWLKLLETPAPSAEIDFPRRDRHGNPIGKLRIMVLPQEKHDEARIRAYRAMQKRALDNTELQNELLREVQGDATAKELLALSCHEVNCIKGTEDAPQYARIFPSGEALGKLTADEISVLFSAYLHVQHRYGPFERDLSEADVDAWIKRLEDGGTAFPLAPLSSPQLGELALLLVERISTLSRILSSQSETLPSSLKSTLEDCYSRIFSYGEPQENQDKIGLENSGEMVEPLSGNKEELPLITLEDAKNLAKSIHKP